MPLVKKRRLAWIFGTMSNGKTLQGHVRNEEVRTTGVGAGGADGG